MFKENKMKDHTNLERNTIAKTTAIVGEISSEGDFRIDGTVEGNVLVKGRVVIGKEAVVKGLIDCANADIEGSVTGNLVVSNLLTLKASAVINGDVIIGKLAVEPGAAFNATCSMKGIIKELNQDEVKTVSEQTA